MASHLLKQVSTEYDETKTSSKVIFATNHLKNVSGKTVTLK
jgi:hypothetical protein